MKPIIVQANHAGEYYTPYWNRMVCGDRSGLALRDDYRKLLATAVRECGFKSLRQHGIFHDDMYVWFEKNKPFNFQYVFSNFDYYLEIGIRPFVELSFLPRWMASSDHTVFSSKCPACPPAEWANWHKMVKATVKALVDRYGIDEVKSWHFEVWNEPNIAFWEGTQKQYFELYRQSVDAVKSVDAELRIGGPATANFTPREDREGEYWPDWVEDFMGFCQREKLPADFISTHPYPTDFPFDDASGKNLRVVRDRGATGKDLRLLREIVDSGPFPHAEIHCNEWGTSPSPRDFIHEHPFSASFLCENLLRNIGLVDSIARWVFCDVSEEVPPGDTEFHGGWGLQTVHGIKKPDFHAYAFLNRLGGSLLHNSDGCVVCRGAAGWQVLLYNHHHYENSEASWESAEQAETMIGSGGEKRRFSLSLEGLPARVRVNRSLVDRDHGWAMRAWQEMGAPAWPKARELDLLRDNMEPLVTVNTRTTDDGKLPIEEILPPLGVMLIEIEKV